MLKNPFPEPKLQPAGAGLPWLELQLARCLFFWTCRQWTHDKASGVIAKEKDIILTLTQGRSPEDCQKRVLIRRLPGMEDSSRYWSLYMTLDHLRIVNNAVAYALGELSQGKVPKGKARTEAVKPGPDAGEESVEGFAKSCEDLLILAGSLQKTEARYAHPWFGPLDAHAWHVMAGFHLKLHRKQIEKIIEGL